MNHKVNNTIAMILVSSLLIEGCSQHKHDGNEQKAENAEAKSDTAALKPFDNVDASVKAQLNGFLAGYFALNKALIEDNRDGAKLAAKKLAETVGTFDMTKLPGEQMAFYHVQLAKLNSGLKGISESGDIEEIRTELISVTGSIYAMVKAYQPNATELYYQFCPMANNGKGANWLSETREIVNPYMGQRMPKCGKTEEVIAQGR